jgi:hexosaminidase
MSSLPLIPYPQEIVPSSDCFALTPDVCIISDAPNRGNAKFLKNRLSTATGYPFNLKQDFISPGIYLKLRDAPVELESESYNLLVAADSIKIEAPTPHGVFNGIQTLLQLLPPEIESSVSHPETEWVIPGMLISDQPRFSWRGFMLDEGRHFHGKETVLNLLDVMASLKLNIFHWHLTEDQGWRIQIQRYPRLTEIGSQRAGTAQSLWDMLRNKHDGSPHAGYYTQHDIREIVTYAAERYITVIPEIEIPGHSKAALAAYPKFSCTGGPFEIPTGFGIFKDIYCPGKESTFTFLQNILDEMMDLFPTRYIHIGGDEAPKARWKKCPDCQRRMIEEGFKEEQALQGYFTNRIADYLAMHNRTIIGWNQVLSDNLHPDALIQYWAGNRKRVINAVRNGRKIVISSYLDYYLDHSYSLTPLSRVYNFEPVFAELNQSDVQNILGVEAPLWTEYVPNRARLDFQTFPRLLALAETGWTTKQYKNYADFRVRLINFEDRLNYRDIHSAHAKDIQPSRLKRMFGLLTLLQPQQQITPRENRSLEIN